VTRHINLVLFRRAATPRRPASGGGNHASRFYPAARKAAQLRHDKALSSWLFQATRLTASNFVRGETRRRRREQEAHMQAVLDESGKRCLAANRSVAGYRGGESVREGSPGHRAPIYEGRNLRDVGAALGASEDAAEKRVSRAVERLRDLLPNAASPSAPADSHRHLLERSPGRARRTGRHHFKRRRPCRRCRSNLNHHRRHQSPLP